MRVAVLDCQRIIFEGVIRQAVLPGADGELSILDDHESIFAALKQGMVRLTPAARKVSIEHQISSKEIKSFFIHQGLARMKNNELVILVE